MRTNLNQRPSRSLRLRLLGCSLVALAAAVAGAAQADCLPTPAPAGPILCSGATVGGVAISTSTNVTVQAGASVAGALYEHAMTFTSLGTVGTVASLQVDGLVNGLGQGGVVVLSGTVPNFNYPSTRLDIKVGQGGVIVGRVGVLTHWQGAPGYNTAGATLDNSGLVQGSDEGLTSSDAQHSGFLSVNNRATGVIRGAYGAIFGSVMYLTNAGLIDGGIDAAYELPSSGSYAIIPQSVNNSGVMTASYNEATLDLKGGWLTVTNSGQIVNTGPGEAIDAANRLNLTNAAGGLIRSAGGVAIRAGGGTFVNRGAIDGSVVLSDQATFDTMGGTLNGDLLFGASDDTLVAGWDSASGRLAGIAGRVDGGGGVNTLRFDLAQDANVDALLGAVALPTNFQNLALNLSNDAKVSLTGDAPSGLMVNGTGSFTTSGVVTTNGTALKLGFYYPSPLNFTNTGSIVATFNPPTANDYALDVRSIKSFSNEGTITSEGGNGVTAYMDYTGVLKNSGSIIATGMGLNLNGGLNNTGLIRSTQGAGLTVWSGSAISTNTGTIEGVTIGAAVNSTILANTGTIRASNGVGVKSGSYARIDNQAGGVITGTKASVSRDGGDGFYTAVLNAGVLNGDVDLRNAFTPSDSPNLYADKGGTLNGSLSMGTGWDTVITDLSRLVNGKFTGVTGTVNAGGGAGVDTLLLTVTEDATRTLTMPDSFEQLALDLAGGAALKLTLDRPLTSTLSLTGEGSLDLTADISVSKGSYAISLFGPSAASAEQFGYGSNPGKLSVISRGALTITQAPYYYASGVTLAADSTFENAGSLTISGDPSTYSMPVGIYGGAAVINSGVINLSSAIGISGATSFTNTGTLKQTPGPGLSIGVQNVAAVVNSGTIETGGLAVGLYGFGNAPLTVANSGVIRSTGADAVSGGYSKLELTNSVTGVIESTTGYAFTSSGDAVHIVNAGTITGDIGLRGFSADKIENTGTITGDIATGYGDDVVINNGTIIGDVALGDGNDSFTLSVNGVIKGVVDGGYGLDILTLDSSKGGSVSSSQFVNFEAFRQTGGGSLSYSGVFLGGPIVIAGGGAEVLAGTSLTAPGATTFLGTSGSEQVTIGGTISGGVSLGGGADTVTNRGAIGAAVLLGAGDDVYTEGAGSTVAGAIDGGAGGDSYIAELDGDRTGLHTRTGFERLGVIGTGRLTLALDQNWDAISLAGTGLTLQQGTFTVGGVSGGDTAEIVTLDRDVAKVDLAGGDDALTLGGDAFAGAYAGGTGTDALAFTTANTVTVSGSITGFETISLAGGNQLNVSGVLGASGDAFAFTGGGQTLSVLSGGKLDGTVDLGAGDDVFRLAAGGQLLGVVLGGTGNDLVAIDLISDLSLRGDQLRQFETLQVTGTGALNFTGGAAKFDHLLTASQNLVVAAGSSLDAGDLTFDGAANIMIVSGAFSGALNLGGGDDVLRLTTGGTLTGSANGGTGNDRLELALGGADAAPIALGATPFSGFETLSLQSGVVSLAGDYGFDTIQVSNGRLIGLAGSRLAARTITVAQGATFGSAGLVTGDITVAGTLSPGASPGTMTVVGNVALASGSTTLFELTPTVSDQLVVSGTVSIAPGATLKLISSAVLVPGQTRDLIVAGGITGSFSTIDGAQALNLHVRQSPTRLRVLGLFSTDTTFSSQVSGVVATLNAALIGDKVGAPLIAALPLLVDATTGKSAPKALARLTPQAYASASQLATEDGLSIVDASRGQARFAPDTPGPFGFGQVIASRRTLDGDAAGGVAEGKINSTGGLSGVGYGAKNAWIGAFAGYLSGRQRIDALDARTDTDSFVVGAQGQVRFGGFALGVMAAHDAADADTRRAAPGGATAFGGYKLKSWVGDVNLTYRAKLNADWAVQPRLGVSYVHANRDGFVERGGGAFSLTVQSEKTTSWFVDGQVEVLGGQAADERLHPYASVGFRTRAGGDDATASASLAGLPTPLTVSGLNRDGTLATVGAGLGYDISRGLTVSATYAGEFGDGGRQGALVGLRWSF
ncbi:putative protein with a C-terminal OMP (outer membrane protein) domain [Caulobacter sp. AP07]|uniref:autotransporter domain-containing protein n=1 Tax=Caulobacter sp. AP07 TaxID=1144304 RepID=UPI000271FBF4|nr:autotransporter domain-containing protein [Caulobacter sp. AP07]EJL38268.1 putative protein with a C-terminal OMP (outer membrane protein) domain [Caulobacter sp. AP07]